jgi:uncharacterized coiled-coil DUF342 family protein
MAYFSKSALIDNPHVRELFSILNAKGRNTTVLSELINSVSAMERQLDAAAKGLESVQRELSAIREERSHPLKTLFEKTTRSLLTKIKGLRTRISAIKNGIINGCKKAVDAFRDKGTVALNNLAGFFEIKQNLLAERAEIKACINEARASVEKIESAAEQFHSAGRAIKNIGRSLRGKETIPAIKPNGKLARLIEAPYRREISRLTRSLRSVNKSLASLDKLETAAAKVAENNRPSVRDTMKRLQKQLDEGRNAPGKPKTKAKEEVI